MAGKPWTAEELELVRLIYPVEKWSNILKQFPGRTQAAIRNQVISQGIKRVYNSRTPWTGAERVILQRLWPHGSWAELLVGIPRHPQPAIAKMAAQMKLRRDPSAKQSRHSIIRTLRETRRKNGMTQERLAELVGSHCVQIAKWERGEQLPRLQSFFDWIEAMGFRLELQKGTRNPFD
jgi:DNA-binding XRE family transcriptional regulator